MVKLSSIKVSFKNEFHIIAPVPSLFCKLCLIIKETIPEIPLNPNIYYLDEEGSRVKLLNDKGYAHYLRLFKEQQTKKLYIEDTQKPLENKEIPEDIQKPPETNEVPDISLPVKRPLEEEENIDSPTKFQKIDISELPVLKTQTKPKDKNLNMLKTKGTYKSKKISSEIQKLALETFDKPSKALDETKQLIPLIEDEVNQFILDAEGKSKLPNLIHYVASTEFLSAVRKTIHDGIKNHGFVNAALFYKIPIELCVHILYDSKMHIDCGKKWEKFKKKIDSCLLKENSKFAPKFCSMLTQQLNNGSVKKQKLIATYDIDEETLKLWQRLFSSPHQAHPTNDPYPNTFRIQIVRDYLEGNFDREAIKNYFGVDQETIENWIYLELEENEEIPTEIQRKRLSKAEKEEIVERYLEKKLAYKEIKMKYGVSQSEVDKWITSKQKGAGLRNAYHGNKASAIMDQAYRFLEFGL